MSRKAFPELVLDIRDLLQKDGELSIRQVARKTGSQWRSVEKALSLLKELKIVKEKEDKSTKRDTRLFHLKG